MTETPSKRLADPVDDLPAGRSPEDVPTNAPGGAPEDAPDDAPARARACLRCGTPFESAWAGERICARCKDSVAWRQGLPYRSSDGSTRR